MILIVCKSNHYQWVKFVTEVTLVEWSANFTLVYFINFQSKFIFYLSTVVINYISEGMLCLNFEFIRKHLWRKYIQKATVPPHKSSLYEK